jgi:hypothetical protein
VVYHDPVSDVAGPHRPVRAVALSADRWLLASVGQDGMIRLWEAPGGAYLAPCGAIAGTSAWILRA